MIREWIERAKATAAVCIWVTTVILTLTIETAAFASDRAGSCLKFPATRNLFCGCSVADFLGLDNSKGQWNAARAYAKFPRTAPGRHKVAQRAHHVMVLLSHVGGDVWHVYDPNTWDDHGRRHVTREHDRSIRGYTIRDPSSKIALR